jgi:hypothetical protein
MNNHSKVLLYLRWNWPQLNFVWLLAALLGLSGCPSGGSRIDSNFLGGVTISAERSAVTVSSSTVSAGGTVTVKLSIKDQSGHPYKSSVALNVAFELSGDGTSTGSFSTPIDHHDGTYTSVFTGSTPGTASDIATKVNGKALTSFPPSIRVVSGDYSLANSHVTVNDYIVASEASTSVTLRLYDSSGNSLAGSGLSVEFNNLNGTSTGLFSEVIDNKDGTYSSTFTGKLAGLPTEIHATINGNLVTSAAPTVTVIPGSASTIAVLSGGGQSAVVGHTLASDFVAVVSDSNGNSVAGANVTWAVSSGGALSNNTSVSNGSGHVSSSLTLGTITGVYTTTASLVGGTSVSFSATALPGTINNFLISSVPVSVVSGNVFNLTVTARDAYNNIKTDYADTIHMQSDDGTATLPGDYLFTSGPGQNNGVTQLSFTLKNTSSPHTITVSQLNGGSPSTTTSGITVLPGAAASLEFLQNPVSALAGSSLGSITVRALDAAGNLATGFTGSITLAIANNAGGGTLAGTKTASASGGVASFSGLSINKAGDGYTLSASTTGPTSGTSSNFNISAATASSITIISGDSQIAMVATKLSQDFVATVTDGTGNPVSGSQVDWSVTPSGTLTAATSSSNGSGQATNTLTLGTVSGTYTVRAALHTAPTTYVEFTATAKPGNIDHFSFTSVPANATAGSSFTFSAEARDSYDNIKTDYTGSVRLSSTDSAATLPIDFTFGASNNGVKQFTATLNTSGNKTITVSELAGGGPANSTASISVVANTATHLVFASSPSDAQAGASIGTITVNALDAHENIDLTFAGTITIAIASNSGGSILAGVKSAAATGGSRNFTGNSLDHVGSGYTLSATAPGLTSSTSNTFSISSGAATIITKSGGDSQSGVVHTDLASTLNVTLTDGNGNLVSNASVSWTVTGNATLTNGTTTTDASGLTSNSLKLGTLTGTYTVTATITSNATSTTFTATATPGALDHFAFTSVPSNATAGASFTFSIEAQDIYNNRKTDYTNSVQFTSSDAFGILPANYTYLLSDSGSKSFTFTLNSANNQTITVAESPGGSPSKTSTAILVGTGVAHSIAVVYGDNQIDIVNRTLDTSFTVIVKDASSNPIAGETIDWTFSPSGTLGASSSTSNGSGQATTTFKLGTTTGAYTVTATVHSNNSLHTSFAATAKPDVIASFVLSSVPGTATAGTSFTFTATAKDSFGNVKTDYSSAVQLTSDDTAATLPITNTFTTGAGANNGVKQFTVTLNTSGTKTISIVQIDGASPTATTAGIVVGGGAATHLGFKQNPVNAQAGSTLGSIIVQALDAHENLASGYIGTINLAIGTNPGTGVLSGTKTGSASGGELTFSGNTIDKAANAYTLTATSAGLISGTSSTFDISPGAASAISVSDGNTQSATVATSLANPLTVLVLDAASNQVSGAQIDWTVSPSTAPASVTSSSLTNGSGLATALLGLGNLAGTYTITAKIHGTLTSTTFTATAIAGGVSAANSTISVSPSAVGVGIASTVTLTLKDSYNNPVSGQTVQFDSSGTLNTPTQPSFATDASGQATGTITSTRAETKTISIALPVSLNSVTTTLTVSAGSATLLTLTGHPASTIAGTSNSVTVTAYDSLSNVAAGYTGHVQFTSNDGAATLPADYTFQNSDLGVHLFSGGVTLKTAGTSQNITVSDALVPGITHGTQTGLTVTAASADHMLLTAGGGDSGTAGSAATTSPKVQVVDLYGNAIANVSITFTVSAGGGSAGSPLTTTDVNGYAQSTFSLGNTIGTNTLTAARQTTALPAAAVGSSATQIFTVTGTHGPAAKLTFTTQPVGNVTAGWPLSAQPVVEIRDIHDNLVTSAPDATASVTLTLTTGTGAITGTASRTASGGVATFTGLSVNQSGSDKVLTATKADTTATIGGTISVANPSNSFIMNTPTAFTMDIPYDSGTASSKYDITNANHVEITSAGVVRLIPADQVDDANDTAGFAGAVTKTGLTWDSSNSVLRLDTTAATATNTAELDSSWTPKWSNLVWYWNMNGTANGVIPTSATPFTATKGGTTCYSNNTANTFSTIANGKLNQAATFSKNNMVTCAGTNVNTISDNITFGGWVKAQVISSKTSYGGIFWNQSSGTYNGFMIQRQTFSNGATPPVYTDTNQVYLRIDTDHSTPSGQNVTCNDSRMLALDGQWHHIFYSISSNGTVSGASGTGTSTLYFDGVKLKSCTFTFYAAGFASGDSNFYLKGPENSGGTGLTLFDEWGVWNTVLSDSEVASIYSRQVAKYSGSIESRVMNAQETGSTDTSWTDFSFTTTLPFFKELPNAASSESSTNYSSLVGSTGSTADNNLMSGLVGLWHLNETAGPTYADSSGNGNNGTGLGGLASTTCANGVSTATCAGAQGIMGNGINLTGITTSSNYINIPNVAPSVGTPITVENIQEGDSTYSVWYKPAAWAATADATAARTDWNAGLLVKPGGHFGIQQSGSGYINFEVKKSDNTQYSFASNSRCNPGIWCHALVVFNKTTGYVYMYVNGKFENSLNIGAGFTTFEYGTTTWRIGSSGSCPAGYCYPANGIIDEVAMWSRTLSVAEILEVYRRGANRIKYQVRTCTLSDCQDQKDITQGKGWKGPSGDYSSYFSELNNTTLNAAGGATNAGSAKMTFSNFSGRGLSITPAQYFQYRAVLESDDPNTQCTYGASPAFCSPELKSVSIGPNHFDSTMQTVTTKTSPLGHVYVSLDNNGITESLGTNACSAGARYTLSGDGVIYYYWNGSAWSVSDGSYAKANPASVIYTALPTFHTSAAGVGTLQVKAFLLSTGTSPCEIDRLQISGQY